MSLVFTSYLYDVTFVIIGHLSRFCDIISHLGYALPVDLVTTCSVHVGRVTMTTESCINLYVCITTNQLG